jgi:hypothetical protein
VLALLIAAEATLLALLLQPHTASAPPGLLVVARAPTLVRLQGDVRLTRPGAGETVLVDDAVTLESRDAIETGDSGRAVLTWPGGAVATVDPQSSLLVRSAVDEATPRLVLERGGLWMDAGPEPTAPTVEALTPDDARVSGKRFQARRDASGQLMVLAADAPVQVRAQDASQDLTAGSMSEVLAGRRPALARPVAVPAALAVTVDGPPAWLLVDRFGRAVGAPPGGGPWLDQLPGVRGPLPRAGGASVVVPDPQGDYQLLFWAGDEPRSYRVAVWSTDGQALFGGPAPKESAGALRFEGVAPAGRAAVLELAVQDHVVAARGAAREVDGVPGALRLAVAPAGPAGRVAALPAATSAPTAAVASTVAAVTEPAADAPMPPTLGAEATPAARGLGLAAPTPTSGQETRPATTEAGAGESAEAVVSAPEDAAPPAEAPAVDAGEGGATTFTRSFVFPIPEVARAADPSPTAPVAAPDSPTPLVPERTPSAVATASGRAEAPALSGTVRALPTAQPTTPTAVIAALRPTPEPTQAATNFSGTVGPVPTSPTRASATHAVPTSATVIAAPATSPPVNSALAAGAPAAGLAATSGPVVGAAATSAPAAGAPVTGAASGAAASGGAASGAAGTRAAPAVQSGATARPR